MRYILLVLLAFVTTLASAQVQFLGSPTTTVRNRGNFVSDSLFYLPKRQVAPTDTAAIRYAISDSSVYIWTGRAWRSIGRAGASFLSVSDTSSMLSPYIRAAGIGLTKSGQSLLVDTAAIATRARVQKAVDSLGAVKGSGTVTSVSAGTGMSFTTITTTGSVAADTTVLSTRAWRRKGLDSLAALELSISDTASMLTPYTRGSGTTNYLPKFTGTRTFGNSVAFDNGGTELIVNSTGDSGAYALQVNGKVFSNSAFYLSANTKWELTASETARLELINRNINQRLAVFDSSKYIAFGNLANSQGSNAALYVNGSANEVYVNSANDIGNYALQVTGSMYNTTGAVLAASSGSVGIGTTSPNAPLHVYPSTNDMQQVWGQYNPAGVFAYMRLHRSTSDGTFTFGTAQNGFSAIAFATSNGTNEAFTERMRIKTDGEVLIGTTTDAGAYALQVAGAIYNTTTITTGAPTGGSIKPWRLGEAATVSPTSPNRTIRVEIDGTVYYIHAKTTND